MFAKILFILSRPLSENRGQSFSIAVNLTRNSIESLSRDKMGINKPEVETFYAIKQLMWF